MVSHKDGIVPIAEKLPITFDIKRIQHYFNKYVKHIEPVDHDGTFGGWSILSASGDYRDGLQEGSRFCYYNEVSGESEFDYEKAHRETGFTWPKLQVNPTSLGGEYIAEVIETIRGLGLNPHRALWTRIPSGSTMHWHRDTKEDAYAVRLHIPVITNSECMFETEEGTFHMPADGSCYLVAVNQLHRAYNHGKKDRIHIIMDVVDDLGISQYHQSYKCRQTNYHLSRSNIIRKIRKFLSFVSGR